MKRFLHLDLILLLLSAIGSFILSGTATYGLLKAEFDPIVALSAVFALETGLAGLVFSIKDQRPSPFWLRVQNTSAFIYAFGILLLLILTNILHRADILQVAISNQVFNWLQVLVFGIAVPILGLISSHRLREVWKHYSHEPVQPPKATKKERISKIKTRGIKKIDVDELAEEFNVSPATIKRDVTEVLIESDKTEF